MSFCIIRSDKNKRYAVGTCLQYLSSFKTKVMNKFPKNSVWVTSMTDKIWYSSVYNEMKAICIRDRITRGIPIQG